MVPVVTVVVAMVTALMTMAKIAVVRAVMKAAIAVTMAETLRLRSRHAKPQCGNQCQCKQFFEHLSPLVW